MATAAERRATESAPSEEAPATESAPVEQPKAAPRFYIATRDLFISGVPAHRIGDTVAAEHVSRYGWGSGVEEPGEDEEG